MYMLQYNFLQRFAAVLHFLFPIYILNAASTEMEKAGVFRRISTFLILLIEGSMDELATYFLQTLNW